MYKLAAGNNIIPSAHNLTCSLLLSGSHHCNLAAIVLLMETLIVHTVDCCSFTFTNSLLSFLVLMLRSIILVEWLSMSFIHYLANLRQAEPPSCQAYTQAEAVIRFWESVINNAPLTQCRADLSRYVGLWAAIIRRDGWQSGWLPPLSS